MPQVGGADQSDESGVCLLPDLRLYEGTQMNEEVKRGEMELITPDEIVEEMELFLTHIDSPGTIFPDQTTRPTM